MHGTNGLPWWAAAQAEHDFLHPALETNQATNLTYPPGPKSCQEDAKNGEAQTADEPLLPLSPGDPSFTVQTHPKE